MNDYGNDRKNFTALKDFEALCTYIAENNPQLTQRGALRPKACYEINGLMTYRQPDAKESHHMSRYHSVSLHFMIGVSNGLLKEFSPSGSKVCVKVADYYYEFKKLNESTRYCALFLSWLRYVKYSVFYANDTRHFWPNRQVTLFGHLFQLSKHREPNLPIANLALTKHGANNYTYDLGFYPQMNDPTQGLMNAYATLARTFRDFGLISFDDADIVIVAPNNREKTVIAQVTVTELGLAVSAVCRANAFVKTNMYEDNYLGWFVNHYEAFFDEYEEQGSDGTYDSSMSSGSIPCPSDSAALEQMESYSTLPEFDPRQCLSLLSSCFQEEVTDIDTLGMILFPDKISYDRCFYEFKVQLDRYCYRIIKCSNHHTYEDLHHAIQSAFDFDNDHLYAFFLDGKRWSENSIWSPYSDNSPSAHEVCLDQVRLRLKRAFLYLFDFGDEWRFAVTLNSITKCELGDEFLLRPLIIKSVGQSPEQYPNSEDWDDWEIVVKDSDDDSGDDSNH